MWIAKVNGSQVLGFDNVGEFDAAWLATQVTAGADDADIRDTRLDFLTCDGQCVIRKPQAEIDAILAAEADAKAAADEKQQDALEADKKAAEEARLLRYHDATLALVGNLAAFRAALRTLLSEHTSPETDPAVTRQTVLLAYTALHPPSAEQYQAWDIIVPLYEALAPTFDGNLNNADWSAVP